MQALQSFHDINQGIIPVHTQKRQGRNRTIDVLLKVLKLYENCIQVHWMIELLMSKING